MYIGLQTCILIYRHELFTEITILIPNVKYLLFYIFFTLVIYTSANVLFQMLGEFNVEFSPEDFKAAMMEENKHKNRNMNILAGEYYESCTTVFLWRYKC